MDALNPYQPPRDLNPVAASTEALSYDGKCLIVPKDYILPAMCIKTGETLGLTPQRRRKFAWYPPMVNLLILVNILVLILVASIVSKKGVIHYQLSRAVARKRRNVLLRNWAIFLASLVFFALGTANNEGSLLAAGGVALVVAMILGLVASRFLWAKKIDATHIYLCGVPEKVALELVALRGAR
jgi:hypothetical protein